MEPLLAVSVVNGLKYSVAKSTRYGFILRVGQDTAIYSVSDDPASDLYYSEIAELLPCGRSERICLLGLGGGTIARRYRQLGGKGYVVGIESDSEILRLARLYFDVDKYVDKIVCANAKAWIDVCGETFDAVVDDCYRGRQKVGIDVTKISPSPCLIIRNENCGTVTVTRK